LAKKGTEAGRYASEFMRNPKLQKKAINYVINKATPVIQKVGSEAINQLSTKVRSNYKYETDRMDLDAMYKGGELITFIDKSQKIKQGDLINSYNEFKEKYPCIKNCCSQFDRKNFPKGLTINDAGMIVQTYGDYIEDSFRNGKKY